MRPGKTLAAVVLLAGLLAFLYFYEYKGEPAREEAERARTQALVFDTAGVARVRIERSDGTAIEVVRKDGAWHLAAPIATRADDGIIGNILNDLTTVRIERTLDGVGASERATFGLDKPAARVIIEVSAPDGSPVTESPAAPMALEIGGTIPVSGGRYASRPGEEGILLVAGNLETVVAASADSLRQKKVFGIDSWAIRRMALKTHDRSVELEKTGSLWRLTGSDTVPADEVRVEAILSSLAPAEATGFADETPTAARLATFGLTPESGAIEVEVAGETTSTRALLGGISDQTGWARRDDMEAVMIVPKSVRESAASALASPESLRDPRPARFNRFALSRLELSGKDGAPRTLFKDGTSSWHLGSKEGSALPSERVNAILDALETLVADHWTRAQGEGSAGQTLSILLAEDEGESAPEPLKLTVWTPAGFETSGGSGREATIGTSIASVRYVVPGPGVDKLLDAVQQLEEPLPPAANAGGDEPKDPAAPDAGMEQSR